jgi:hypothetical protein
MAHDPSVGQAAVRKAGVLETARAVLWSFFGVRARRAHEADAVRLNPVVVILTGVVLAAVFVVGLITLVRFVVS